MTKEEIAMHLTIQAIASGYVNKNSPGGTTPEKPIGDFAKANAKAIALFYREVIATLSAE